MLSLKLLNKIDVSGTYLRIVDKTGVVSVDNPGGWGAPNPDRSLNALMAIIKKIHTDGTVELLQPTTQQIIYNSELTNEYESEFEFAIGDDGGHIHYLLQLPVSNDGITTLEGATLEANDYFYMVDGNVYKKQTDGSYMVVEDYSELIDETNENKPTQSFCQKMWTPALSIKEGSLYNDYRLARQNCDNEDVPFNEGLELYLNIVHANGLFYQGLQMEAESVIETELDKYELR